MSRKSITLGHLLESARQAVSQLEALKTVVAQKQDVIIGEEGKIITFNKAGSLTMSTLEALGAVLTSRKINNKPLSADITLNASDVGARPSTWTPSAADVGARPATWTPSAADVGAVPTTRKVAGKALSSDITLSASDVGARPSTWLPSLADISAVPTSRKVAGKPLTADVTLTAADVGARPSTWLPSLADIGAAASSHGTHVSFTTTAPLMNGTAAVGTAGTVARSDHVHPTDTSRAAASHSHSNYVPTTRKVAGKALSADVTLAASDVGALALTGGTVTGKTTYTGGLAIKSAAQNNSMAFFIGITAFDSGGDVQWIAKDAVVACIGAAAASHTHSNYSLTSHTHTGMATAKRFTVTVSTGWTSNSSGGYYKTVSVSGITANDCPIIGVVLSSDTATAKTQLQAAGCVNRVETLANQIKLYAYNSAPTTAFSIQLLCVRGF